MKTIKRICTISFIFIFGISFLSIEKVQAQEKNFLIKNSANSKCLDAQEYGSPNGANVQLWECNGKKWQKWYKGNNSEIINLANGKCLDAQEYGGPSGANVQLWDCNGKSWQQWKQVGSEFYNKANDKCLDSQEYGRPNGANVQLWDCNKKSWQIWENFSEK